MEVLLDYKVRTPLWLHFIQAVPWKPTSSAGSVSGPGSASGSGPSNLCRLANSLPTRALPASA